MTTIANMLEETPTLPLVSQLRLMAGALITADEQGIHQSFGEWHEYVEDKPEGAMVLAGHYCFCALSAITMVLMGYDTTQGTELCISLNMIVVQLLKRGIDIRETMPVHGHGHNAIAAFITHCNDVYKWSFTRIAQELTAIADRIEQGQP